MKAARSWPWWYAPVGLVLGGLLPLGILVQLERFHARPPLGAGTLIIEAVFVAIALGLARMAGPVERAAFGLRPMRITPGRAGLWILIGLICVLILDAIYLGIVRHPGSPRLYDHFPTGIEAWLVAAAAVIGAPVGEELFFRGLVHRALRTRMNWLPAVAVSASLFGLAHWWFGDPIGTVFPRVMAGVLLALLLERTGSLYPGMACHAMFNLGVATVALPAWGTKLLWIPPLAWFVAILVSLHDPRRKRGHESKPRPAAEVQGRGARVSFEQPEVVPREVLPRV